MSEEDVIRQQSREVFGNSAGGSQSQPGTYQDPRMNGQNQLETYQDPLQGTGKEAGKKKVDGSGWIATVVTIVLVRLIGLIGALICYGGFWAVRAIIKSKMAVGAKVILSIVVIVAFLVLLVVFFILGIYLSASING